MTFGNWAMIREVSELATDETVKLEKDPSGNAVAFHPSYGQFLRFSRDADLGQAHSGGSEERPGYVAVLLNPESLVKTIAEDFPAFVKAVFASVAKFLVEVHPARLDLGEITRAADRFRSILQMQGSRADARTDLALNAGIKLAVNLANRSGGDYRQFGDRIESETAVMSAGRNREMYKLDQSKYRVASQDERLTKARTNAGLHRQDVLGGITAAKDLLAKTGR